MQIDEEILQEVLKMGFDRSALVDSLRNRVQNEVNFVTVSCHSHTDIKIVLAHCCFLGYCYILSAARQSVPGFQWLPWS